MKFSSVSKFLAGNARRPLFKLYQIEQEKYLDFFSGVPELRQEIEKLEKKLSQREKEREELTQGIGAIDDQLLLMMAENDRLRDEYGLGRVSI